MPHDSPSDRTAVQRTLLWLVTFPTVFYAMVLLLHADKWSDRGDPAHSLLSPPAAKRKFPFSHGLVVGCCRSVAGTCPD